SRAADDVPSPEDIHSNRGARTDAISVGSADPSSAAGAERSNTHGADRSNAGRADRSSAGRSPPNKAGRTDPSVASGTQQNSAGRADPTRTDPSRPTCRYSEDECLGESARRKAPRPQGAGNGRETDCGQGRST